MDNKKLRLAVVFLFSAAMAWVEAACVIYLRTLLGRLDPYQPHPLAMSPGSSLTRVEAFREAATLIMLLSVGWIAGKKLQDRLGHFVFAFGLWDIAYYVWLAVFQGWPRSPFDWDVLFLIPVPWWGPVLAPVLIAAMMCVSGAAAVRGADRGVSWRLSWTNAAVAAAGIAVVLLTFTIDGLRAMPEGVTAVGRVRPSPFEWPVFMLGFVTMSWAGLRVTWPGRSWLLRT